MLLSGPSPAPQPGEGPGPGGRPGLLAWSVEERGLTCRSSGGLAALFAGLPEGGPRTLAELLTRIAAGEEVDRLLQAVAAAASGASSSVAHRAPRPGLAPAALTSAVFPGPRPGTAWGVTVEQAPEAPGPPPSAARPLEAALRELPLGLLVLDGAGRPVLERGLRLAGAAPGWLEEDLRRARAGARFVGGGALGERQLEVHYAPDPAAPGGVLALAVDVSGRHRAEREVQRSLDDLREVLDTMDEAISVQDREGRVVFVNRAALRSLDLEHGPGRPSPGKATRLADHYELFDEAGRPIPPEELPGRRALRGEPSPPRLMHGHRRGRTTDHWVMLRASPLRDARGEVRLVVNAWTEVTEIQQAREELRRQKALLQAQSEASPDGILVVGRGGRVLFHNRRFAELWGLSPEVLALAQDGRLLEEVQAQLADPEAFLRRVAELYRSPRESSRDELRLRDGRTLERYSGPVCGEGGEDYGRVWFFRDVTARKEAAAREQQLREARAARAATARSERRWRFLAEAGRRLGDTLELDQVLATLAQAAAPGLGACCVVDLLEGGALRRAVAHHASPPAQARAARLLQLPVDPAAPRGPPAALRAGQPRWEPAVPDLAGAWGPLGEPRPDPALYAELGLAELYCLPLVIRERPLGVLTLAGPRAGWLDGEDQNLARELAHRAAVAVEHAQLYRRTREAIAARDEFLAVASHELRTPLTSLRLALQALGRGVLGPEARARLGLAERQEQRLSRLVASLLDVTHLQAGELRLELGPVDLAQVAGRAAEALGPAAARAGCELRLHAPAPVVGRWDEARLEQVARSLLGNALKYGAGRPVELEVDASPGWARLVVRDRGIGIPAERQATLFGRFGRAVSVRHYGGLGLELYILRGIVQGLGGSVSVESREGEGATFTVLLPVAGPGA